MKQYGRCELPFVNNSLKYSSLFSNTSSSCSLYSVSSRPVSFNKSSRTTQIYGSLSVLYIQYLHFLTTIHSCNSVYVQWIKFEGLDNNFGKLGEDVRESRKVAEDIKEE